MAEESLVTTLGFDAQQAIVTLKQLELQLNNYTNAMRRAGNVTSKFNKQAAGIEKNYQTSIRGAKAFTSATKQQSVALQSSEKQIKKAGKTLNKLGEQSKKTTGQMVLSWQSVIRIFTIQVIHQMISKVTSAFGSATSAASDLEINLAEIQTIGGPLRNDFEGLADNVRELSDAFGVQAEIVAEGIYQTLSNQVGRATESFTFFAAAADFSIAAVTSADAAVNLLSSTVNAFGYNASQATLIGAKLFKAIELGRIRGEEFANTFGRVAVLASKLGISLDEVLASITTLTISGLKYNEAFTLINNVMLKLIRPTEELQNVFDKLGIVTIEAGIQAYGFQGLLGKLAETTGGTATEMGKLFGRVRAVRGALGLTGEATRKYEEDLKAIREVTPETLFEAKQLIFETNAKQIQIEIETLRNAIVFDFGRKVLEIINRVINAFGGLKNIATAAGAGVGVAAISLIGLAAVLHPVAAAIIAAGAAVSVLTAVWLDFNKTAMERIEERLNAQKRAIIEINAAEAKAAETRIRYFQSEFSILQRALTDRLAAVHRIKQQTIMVEELISDHFNAQLNDRRQAFDKFVQSLIGSMKQAKDNINKAQENIFTLQRKLSQEIFEGQTRSYNETRKAQTVLQRSMELSKQGAREFKKGHRGRATQLFDESRALAEQAKSIGQSIDNLSIERNARNTIQQIIKDQIKLQQQSIKEEEKRGKSLSEQVSIEDARARRITAIVEKLKEFKIFDVKGEILFATKEEALAAVIPLLNVLQKELTAVGSKINIFKRLEETGKTDLQDALKDVLEPIDAMFAAEKIELNFAYKERINTIFKDIQNVADQLPIKIKLKLIALGLDPTTLKGMQDASKGLVEIFKDIERSVRASASLKGEQKLLEVQMKSIKDASSVINNLLDKRITIVEHMWDVELQAGKRAGETQEIYAKRINQTSEVINRQKNLFVQFESAASRAKEQLTGTFDRKIWKDAISSLEGVAIAQEQIGEIDMAKNIRIFIEKLTESGETASHIGSMLKGAEIPYNVEALQKMEDIFGRQEELSQQTVTNFQNLGLAATSAATIGNNAFDSMQNRLKTLQFQANETGKAIANITSGAAIPARLGRMIYRQYGGYTPQSTDTVPAMLSPGEFVVNARSARRFHSQLIAMNSDIQPVFRRSGGSTTNIGDINIAVHDAVSPKQTAREMMLAFRREVRRGTSKNP